MKATTKEPAKATKAKETKEISKPEKAESTKAKPSRTSEAKFTRIEAACTVLKANPKLSTEAGIKAADALYAKSTGATSNPKEQAYSYHRVVQVMTFFSLL